MSEGQGRHQPTCIRSPLWENSASGQGIRWEFANGLESAANQNSSSAEERAKLLSEAVENLKLLSQGNGVYRKSAAKKLEELGAK